MPPESKPPIRWSHVAAWTGVALAGLAIVGYFGSSILLNRYLRSDAFRALLGEKTSAFFAAEGEYRPIHCNGFSFYSDGYTAHSVGGAPLKQLQADQIRADFEPAALFQGAWQVSHLQIQRVNVTLNAAHPPATQPPPPQPAAPSKPRSRWIPERFELKRAQIETANLAWTPPGRAGSLQGMRLVLEPSGHDVLATGYGGRLQQAGWPVLKVDHIKLRSRYPDLFVTDSLFQIGEGEYLTVSGQAGLGQNRAVDLLVKFNGIGISPYLPEDWRARVKGSANGEARVTGSLDNASSLQAAGHLTITDGLLEALPVLEKIAAFTHTQEFRRCALQKAEADFVCVGPKLTVSQLVAESEGLIRMEGGFILERGTLQGTFQLGVSPASLHWLPGSRTRVFTQEHDGYAWTTLTISGPLDHLTEDLSTRLVAAAGDEVIEGVKGTLENGVKGTLDGAKSLFDLLK
ncbi:MAG: hypothetical protein WCO68_03915 [Verrucomicrobiota bacterium]